MLAQMVTNSPTARRERKGLGAFYSPLSLVEPMVSWAITNAEQSVLDPSCGDGVFLEAASRGLRALGASPERIDAASYLRRRSLDGTLEVVQEGRPFHETVYRKPAG